MSVAICVAVLIGATQHTAAPASAYKCYVSDSLFDGLVPGKVQAAGSVDCSGYGGPGSVRFSVRLQQYDDQAKKWKTVASRGRSFKTLKTRHSLAVTSPCVVTKFRATYRAVLHNTARRRVSTNTQRLGPLLAHVPCVFAMGG